MAENKLLVSGGCLRNADDLEEGKYYGKATLLLLDLSTGEYRELLSKSDGGEHYPPVNPNQQYTAASLDGDVLWLPTDTEIFKYRLPELILEACYSHSCFHNIHSVHAFDDFLIVTSTGLDNVVILDKHTGQITRVLNSEGKDPWHRFSSDVDYRIIYSTRPHDSHPNFVFRLDGKYWVTRCKQEDAICLEDINNRIDISQGANVSVHDGLWWNDKIIFTRVDGFLVFCDPISKKVIETVDIFALKRNRLRGWCRGLWVDGETFYIGFSKLRTTKSTNKLKFLMNSSFINSTNSKASVVAFDMNNKTVNNIYQVPDCMIDSIYGILPYRY
ncbi:MAG: hypothetical protein JXR26_09020 [Balneolaceae bacterium]|nr:hypothetical protein [Balneolaceae bacterium]